MADSPASSSEASRPADENLVTTLRREIVAAELQILELNDRLAAKDTDRADAVALLGQAELVLEEKIGYIMTLDQALNTRIRELEQECDRKTAEIDRRGEALQAAHAADERNRAERDAVIKDLSERLEAANQEINRAHELARDYAEKFNGAEQALAATKAELAATTEQLTQTQTKLTTRDAELADALARIEALSAQLNDTTVRLSTSEETLAAERGRLHTIFHSTLWRWGRPWRALFGPKL
ncbi:hypothetical protein [Actomonas aquatica]|uniref:Chromosome partition protein Smc n=1 Tax=Actomonas aquatica TaxID=2866162 RepID=A0ABZ1C9Y4_9BACT|nr:hypothetical protein [Opitutus sp. WL0086]WRQ88497.1 hypothetical protein K1X11_003720 [Opitutus sp. WL0086]